jgi:putative ABC transport system permease protein
MAGGGTGYGPGFAWRMLWRDWRGGELGILAVALVIAVTSVTAVGFFIDRVDRGMQQQAAELIGADLVVSAPRALAPDLEQQAAQRGLRSAQTLQFRSVALVGERPHLVEVKAVSAGYPLRGVLRTATAAFGADQTATGIPARHTAWVEARLLQLLGVDVGDSLQLGAGRFTVARVLTYEPDRGGDMFSVAPRVLINRQDVPGTDLIQTGSLVNYRLLIAGEPAAVQDLRGTLRRQLAPDEQLLTVKDGRPELRSALERARRFLGLAALVSVLLAGVAVATAARRFARRHLDTSAILRCLGATQGAIIRAFSLEMLWLALFASTVGALFGLLMQTVVARILAQLLLIELPGASLRPLALGYATGLVLLLGFALPPLLALRRVPPLRVLRRDLSGKETPAVLVYAAVPASMGVLLYWQIGELYLVLYTLGGMLGTLLLLALGAWGLVNLLKGLRQRVGVAWRFGLANIARRPAGSVVQIVAFGLGIMVLLATTCSTTGAAACRPVRPIIFSSTCNPTRCRGSGRSSTGRGPVRRCCIRWCAPASVASTGERSAATITPAIAPGTWLRASSTCPGPPNRKSTTPWSPVAGGAPTKRANRCCRWKRGSPRPWASPCTTA